jgi:hypothetical protein
MMLMKKVLFVLSLFLCLSCGQKAEMLIIGNWTLTKAECENFDEFALAKGKIAIMNIDQNIAQIKRNLETAQNEGEREKLKKRIEELSSKKTQAYQSVKTDIEATLKATEGNMIYTFSDGDSYNLHQYKRFSVKTDSETLRGSYKIIGDTISVILDNQEQDRFVIKTLTASSLVISNIQEEFQKENSMKMVLNFKKD